MYNDDHRRHDRRQGRRDHDSDRRPIGDCIARAIHERKTADLREKNLNKNLKYFLDANPAYSFPDTAILPSQDQMEGLYRDIYSEMRLKELPIVQLSDLIATKCTLPTDHPFTHEQIRKISDCLYARLTNITATTNTVVLSRLKPFEQERDGYGALWHLMTFCVTYLAYVRPCWGPDWTPTMTPHDYVVSLQDQVRIQNLVDRQAGRTGNSYPPLECALEFCLQAQTHARYQLAAMQLQTEVEHCKDQHLPDLPDRLRLVRMAQYITNHATPTPALPPHLGVKQFRDPRDKKKPGFKYDKKSQCDACKQFGHTIDGQVCRDSAKFFHITKWKAANPELFADNAAKFNSLNKVHAVNLCRTHHAPDFETCESERDHDATCEKFIGGYYDAEPSSVTSP